MRKYDENEEKSTKLKKQTSNYFFNKTHFIDIFISKVEIIDF